MGALRTTAVCLLALMTSQAAEYEVVCKKQLNEYEGRDGYVYKNSPLTPYHNPVTIQGCFGVAVCRCLTDTEVYPAGNHVYVRFQTDWKGLYIEYYTFPNIPSEVYRTSRVYLICDHGQEKFEAIGETGNTTGVYEMHLWSRYACANVTSPEADSKPDIYRKPKNDHRPITHYVWDMFHLVFVYGVLGLVFVVHQSRNRQKRERLLLMTPISAYHND